MSTVFSPLLSSSLSVALLVVHYSTATVIVNSEDQHSEDSQIFNIRPLLFNAPKTQKNVKFSADAEKQQQFKRSLSNTELFQ